VFNRLSGRKARQDFRLKIDLETNANMFILNENTLRLDFSH